MGTMQKIIYNLQKIHFSSPCKMSAAGKPRRTMVSHFYFGELIVEAQCSAGHKCRYRQFEILQSSAFELHLSRAGLAASVLDHQFLAICQ